MTEKDERYEGVMRLPRTQSDARNDRGVDSRFHGNDRREQE